MSKASNKRVRLAACLPCPHLRSRLLLAAQLAKESQMIAKDPPPFIFARPREDNILEWHYILRGPPETPFAGGEYWGQVIFRKWCAGGEHERGACVQWKTSWAER